MLDALLIVPRPLAAGLGNHFVSEDPSPTWSWERALVCSCLTPFRRSLARLRERASGVAVAVFLQAAWRLRSFCNRRDARVRVQSNCGDYQGLISLSRGSRPA